MGANFFKRSISEERLKEQLLQAVAARDPDSRIAKLYRIHQQLKEEPARFPQLWVPLLNAVAQAENLPSLSEIVLKEFEETGTLLLQILTNTNIAGAIWSCLADIYSTRGDQHNAQRLFVRIYSTPALENRWRILSIRELARRQLQSDEFISMYVDYVQWAAEPEQEREILSLLNSYCAVTFASPREHIKRAGELVSQLFKRHIMLPCTYTTLGLYSLSFDKALTDAACFFEAAYKADSNSELALIGLLATWIRNNVEKSIDEVVPSRSAPLFNEPLIQALIQFYALTQWLESRTSNNPPPLTTNSMQQFAALGVPQYVGDVFLTAYARLHLLEGNAREALALIESHIQRHPEQLYWHYYAAWAEMQLGEKEALGNRYHFLVNREGTPGEYQFTQKNWPGCWLVACLLLDTDPSFDEKYDVQLYLREIAKVSPQYASVIETRLALASARYPLTFTWRPEGGSIEEDLEALRTGLGYALYIRDYAQMKQYTLSSLFQHLPIVDQKMWMGTMLLMVGNEESTEEQRSENKMIFSPTPSVTLDIIEQGRQQLEEVASQYNYQRAVLILAVHYLDCNLFTRAKNMLQSFITATGRTDTKIQLLKLYIARLEGNTVADLGKSVRQRELAARAYYAQGCLDLREARYESAARTFQTALVIPYRSLPEDCYSLEQCAQFLAAPGAYNDLWGSIKHISAKEQRPFLIWCAFLARLYYASPADIAGLWPNICTHFENLARLADEARLAIAQMITRACQQATSREQFEIFMQMLSRISTASTHPMLKRLRNVSIASIVCKNYLMEENRESAYGYLNRQLQNDPFNAFLVIFLVRVYLERYDIRSAIDVLDRTFFPECQPEQDLCRFLASLLKGQAEDSASLPLLLDEAVQRDEESKQLVDMLRLFPSGDSDKICQLIFTIWQNNRSSILSGINMPSLLPYLCAHAVKTRTILPQLVDLLQQEASKPLTEAQQITLARCFVAVGQLERANTIWQRLSERSGLSPELARESAVLLCHMALQANHKGDKQGAIERLQEAAMRVNGRPQANLKALADGWRRQYTMQKMLTEQFPGFGPIVEVPGRYHGFQPFWRNHSEQRSLSRSAWRGCVYTNRNNSTFLHMLAITYREYVLMQMNKQIHEETYITINTILWGLLLCADGFWQSFSQERIANSAGERVSLSDIQREQLFEETIEHLFSLSRTHARRAFNESRYNDASIHLRCLHLCSQGTEVLRKKLLSYKLAFEIPLNGELAQKMSTAASDMLTQWCSQLLREAREALDSLPESGENYEVGLQKLKPFIDMQIPVKQVLITCLEWYNAWCFSIQSNRIPGIVAAASPVAEQLMPFCTKGRGYLPENRAIAEHLTWRGATTFAPIETVRNFYQEALQWNASDRDAQRLLKNLPEKEEGEEFDEEEDDDYFDHYSDDYL